MMGKSNENLKSDSKMESVWVFFFQEESKHLSTENFGGKNGQM